VLELELKAAVPDSDAVRAAVRAAGGTRHFHGRLRDRRYDAEGRLTARDEVLRVRRYESADGTTREELTWKGPTHLSPEGYKARQELECRIAGGAPAHALLEALGYVVVHAIDRHVEVWHVAGGSARLEWYPDADTLLEIEGEAPAIERIAAATGLPPDAFTAEALPAFARRFAARSGRPARLALLTDDEQPSHWPLS
jgi:predicted adenylyl cyclase CyaB